MQYLELSRGKVLTHGIGGYNAGCRCDGCRGAKIVKREQYQSVAAKAHESEYAALVRATPTAKMVKSEYDRRRPYDPAYHRAKHLRQTFGLTMDDYDRMASLQDGVCAICHNPPTMNHLSIDHDHRCCSGKKSCGNCIRGLLCQKCNGFLGRIKEDPSSLVAYLEKGGAR